LLEDILGLLRAQEQRESARKAPGSLGARKLEAADVEGLPFNSREVQQYLESREPPWGERVRDLQPDQAKKKK
jgi:hypothetical protein